MSNKEERNEYMVQQDVTQRTPADQEDLDEVSASFVRFEDLEEGTEESAK